MESRHNQSPYGAVNSRVKEKKIHLNLPPNYKNHIFLITYHIQHILKIQLFEMLLTIELMIKKHFKNTFWQQVFLRALYKIVWI